MVDLSSSLYMSTFTRVFCYSNLHKKIPSPWSAWPCILRYPDIPSSAESHQQIELHLGKSDKTSHRCVHRRAPCSQCICWPPEGGERLKECCWKIENQQIETDMIWYDMMATWCQLDRYPWKTRAVWSSSICSCDLIYWTTAAVGVQVRDRIMKNPIAETRSVPSSIAYLLLRSWLPKFTLWLFSIAMENHHF